jgi:membrane-associated phospholipid phosphatase
MSSLIRQFLVLMLANSIVAAAQTQSNAPSGAPEPEVTAEAMSPEIRIIPPTPTSAEENRGWLPPGTDPNNTLGWSFVKHLASDQKAFWTSGKDLKGGGAKTFVPFAAFTGLLIASDSWLAKQVPDKPNQLNRSNHISQYATYSLVGAAGGSFLWGHLTKNDRLRETGTLSGEALLNSTAATFALRGIARRERPFEAGGSGKFFQGGSSFPSEHSAIAWSVATVVAHEYPGPLTKFFAYGLASAVTLTRVTSKQHFASDAFVGSALGWYLGRQVYRVHHDPELGGAPWGGLLESTEKGPRKPENMGSPYVPLDSWVYPALERLAALGYVQTAYLGMRPWTRMEWARLLEEASERMRYDGIESGQGQRLYTAVVAEFADERARLDGAANLDASLDSVYTRASGISGTALRDGYHFGQTLINDYGRPYGQGFNAVSGITAHAVAGPFAFYVRGEYQHAPGSPSDPPQALQATANADLTLPVSNAKAEANRFDMLEGYVALNLHDTQISFGKQSLWLGPGEAGPLLFSDNAESMLMLKIEEVSPYAIPLLSRVFGPARSEFFLGQLSGHQFEFNGVSNTLLGPGNIDPQPFLHGSKISFKPTENLEFGMGFTAQFAGPGLPFTWHNFLRTFFSHTSGTNNPGKRLSSFDFSYRVPGLRKWLTVYNDSLVVDEFSPIGSSRPTVNPGIYMPQVPKLPKLELRAEGLKEPLTREFGPGFVYYGLRRFRSGYTNNGNLLGNWIGRAGRGGQGWLTYSFSPHTRLQCGYRLQEVSHNFLEGGRLADYSVSGNFLLSRSVALSGLVQYEQWNFPVLSQSKQANLTTSFQLTFYPKGRIRK